MVASIPKIRRDEDLLVLFGDLHQGTEQDVARFAEESCGPLADYARHRGAVDPDGVAHLTIIDVVQRADDLSFDSPQQLWGYLYRVANSKIAGDRRRDSRRPETDPISSEIEHPSDDSEEQVLARLMVQEVLEALTPAQAEVLALRFLADKTIAETAISTGRTEHAVKGLQRRALRAAAALLMAVVAIVGWQLWSLIDQPSSVSTVSDETPDPATSTWTSTSTDVPGVGAPDQPTVSVAPAPEQTSGVRTGPTTTTPGAGPAGPTVVEPGGVPGVTAPAESRLTSSPGSPRSGSAPGTTTTTTTGSRPVTTSRSSATIPSSASTTTSAFPTTPPAAPTTDLPTTTVEAGPADPIWSCGGVSGTVAELTSRGYHVLIGTDGDDRLRVDDRPGFVIGGDGDDHIDGDNDDDIICAGPGNDDVEGDDGNDRIYGGPGDDDLEGRDDDDYIDGGSGADDIEGNSGDDVLIGGPGIDRISGGSGSDVIDGVPDR